MPTASIDVMQPARGHGQCRQEDGEIPNRRDDFIVHNKIKYRRNDTDNDKEKVGKPELRATGPAGKIYIILEKARNSFRKTHRRRYVSETIATSRRGS